MVSSFLSPPDGFEVPIPFIRACDSSRSKSDLSLASEAATSTWPRIRCFSSSIFSRLALKSRVFCSSVLPEEPEPEPEPEVGTFGGAVSTHRER